MKIGVENLIRSCGVSVGVSYAQGVRVEPSPLELEERLSELIAQRSMEDFPPTDLRQSIRDLLRLGGFKPSGRNKPASEYLAQAAREGRFPRINNLVDINNFVSLETGLPASLLDAEVVGPELLVRFGLEGEHYVFNTSGQEIDLKGLICVCASGQEAGIPLGNPIKDSMQAKISQQTASVLAIVYCSKREEELGVLAKALDRFEELFSLYGHARSVETLAG